MGLRRSLVKRLDPSGHLASHHSHASLTRYRPYTDISPQLASDSFHKREWLLWLALFGLVIILPDYWPVTAVVATPAREWVRMERKYWGMNQWMLEETYTEKTSQGFGQKIVVIRTARGLPPREVSCNSREGNHVRESRTPEEALCGQLLTRIDAGLETVREGGVIE